MAEAIVWAVLKFTAGSIWDKCRETVAKRLRCGDEFHQTLARIITSDFDAIKTNLKATNLKELLTSIDFYNEGVKCIDFDTVDSSEPPRKKMKVYQSPPAGKFDVADFPEASKVTLSPDAKENFKDARKNAVSAMNNTALKTMYRILATYIRVMAQLLEKADDPERALLLCRENLKTLHSMETIRANFKTELTGNFAERKLKVVDRRKVIRLVYHVNRFVFDIAQMVGGSRVFQDLFIWPTIEIKSRRNGKEEIDVLRDSRVGRILLEKMSPVVWSFGDQGEEDHRLKCPRCIATNTKGEFVVLDNTTIKTYNSSGEYLNYSCLPGDCKFEFHTVDADTDKDGNLYLLAWKTSEDYGKNKEKLFEVFVFDKDGVFKNKFSLRNKSKGHKIALNSHGNHTEVFVLESGETGLHDMVGVYHYETEGVFDHQFGNGILQDAKDIVSATNGRILVLDKSGCGSKEESCVRVFDAGKQYLNFDVSPGSVAVTYHQASQHIVIVSVIENRDELLWSIYNINTGQKERAYKHKEAGILSDPDITVTSKGRIAIALTTQDCDGQPKGKVIVF